MAYKQANEYRFLGWGVSMSLPGSFLFADRPAGGSESRTAVLVVDIQADFTEAYHGPLAVPGADEEYLARVNRAVEAAFKAGLPIFATQDWHPAGHLSCAGSHPGRPVFEPFELEDGRKQMLWPDHCIQGTPGAELLIDGAKLSGVIQKGTDPRYDSYSGFADDGGAETGLAAALKSRGIDRLIVFGLAADYCVRYTVMDGLNNGFEVIVIKDLTLGIDDETTADAWREMAENGARLVASIDVESAEDFLSL